MRTSMLGDVQVMIFLALEQIWQKVLLTMA